MVTNYGSRESHFPVLSRARRRSSEPESALLLVGRAEYCRDRWGDFENYKPKPGVKQAISIPLRGSELCGPLRALRRVSPFPERIPFAKLAKDRKARKEAHQLRFNVPMLVAYGPF